MAIAPDTKTALVALNRFGFGARGGSSDLARATTDPRGFLKAELQQPAVAKLEASTLPTTSAALQAVYAEQEQKKIERGAAAKTPAPQPSSPDMMRAVGSDDTMGKSDPPKSVEQPIAQKLFRADAMARFQCVAQAEAGFAERLVHFWSNHFCVSALKGPVVRASAGSFEREAIRPYVLGRFADMLLAVEKPSRNAVLPRQRPIVRAELQSRAEAQARAQREPGARNTRTAYAGCRRWLHAGRRHVARPHHHGLDVCRTRGPAR